MEVAVLSLGPGLWLYGAQNILLFSFKHFDYRRGREFDLIKF